MKLKLSPFEKIKNGSKTVELRLYDEKRQKVQVGDFIEFTCLDKPKQKIQTRVTALHKFTSFAELYNSLPKEKLGYKFTDTPDPNHMDEFYSREDQEKYGILGIELYCTDLQKFIDAQESGYSFGETYATALSEMKQGYKVSHWIWYVFPQIQGLGLSGTTAFFSIHGSSQDKPHMIHVPFSFAIYYCLTTFRCQVSSKSYHPHSHGKTYQALSEILLLRVLRA